MLDTLSSSSTPHPPPAPALGGSPVRPRGAQPFNRNAFRHGYFARRNPTPLTQLVASLRVTTSGLDGVPEILRQIIPALRQQIARLFTAPPAPDDLRLILAWHRPVNRLLGLFVRLQKTLARSEAPQLHLQFVAARAIDLIHYDFHSFGITRDADSFRDFFAKSDFNTLTASPLTFLTPHQWRILDPLLPSFMQEHGKMGVWGGEADQNPHFPRLGRPPTEPILLLDAIFWKLAHHARWQDLQNLSPLSRAAPPRGKSAGFGEGQGVRYPPMLTCRRYYRRLFLSGRLWTLYKALYKDFLAHAGTTLPAMVEQGHFTISGHALTLRPDLNETWQSRTALLFLQQAWHVSRCILREKE